MTVEKDWEKLNDYRHARLRLEMYLGSRNRHTESIIDYDHGKPVVKEITWVPAVAVAFREVLDNALDEMITHGHGNTLDVSYDSKNHIFVIADGGRGIPINFDKKENQYAATVLLSETKAGRNFGKRTNTRGLNGVGASVVNMVSEYFDVEIHRDGKCFNQRFHEGDENLIIEDAFITPTGKKTTGSRIEFKLSSRVFKDMILPESFVKARLYEIALLYPKLKITFNKEKIIPKGTIEKVLFDSYKPISISIEREGFKSDFWLIPNFFSESGKEHVHSLVNAIPVFQGGEHIKTFDRLFYSNMLAALSPLSKKRKLNPNRSDLSDGMLIFNVTEMNEPVFDSQSKTRLMNEEVATIIKEEFANPEFFKSIIKKYPDWIEIVFNRCAERTMKKDSAETSKLAKKNLRTKVEDLSDACGFTRSKCVIFITEGLCLEEKTKIMVLRDGGFVPLSLKEVEVGDLVLTHSNNIKPIVSKWKKTSKSLEIMTPYGNIICSPEHRFLVHDRTDNDFKWIEAINIDKTIHRFVKNKIVDCSHVEEIIENRDIDEGIYKHCIVFGNNFSDLKYQLSSPEHKYSVLDFITMKYITISAKDIDPRRHAMMMKME